jgi:hypothetical protein
MMHLILIITILLAPSNHTGLIKDTCEIDEPDYKGYIMTVESYPFLINKFKYKLYRPSRNEVFRAESLLKIYLDSYCKKNGIYDTAKDNHGTIDIDQYDCMIAKYKLLKYYRQYIGWVVKKNHHKVVYFDCISQWLQKELNLQKESSLKKSWVWGICDGGPILFHVEIDLNTGKVDFRDNGYG